MGVNKYYLISSADYETLKNGGSITKEGQVYYFDEEGAYFTDKITADMIDDTNSDKKIVTPEKAALWNKAASTQADWNETDEDSLAYIKNKPTLQDAPVTDVKVRHANSSSYVSVVSDRVAKIDLSSYLNRSALKTVNGASMIVSGSTTNLDVDKITYQYITAASSLPKSNNTTGYLSVIVIPYSLRDCDKYSGYLYCVEKQ